MCWFSCYYQSLSPNFAAIIEATRRWISSMVIGLNLCPFAQKVFDAGTIRYVVSDAMNPDDLKVALASELLSLVAHKARERETTFLIHPHVLTEFLDYNDFLDAADQVVEALGLTGIIQIASFHPGYQFAGTHADDPENYSNRSPYPMLHLLREQSISDVADTQDLAAIPKRNRAALTKLGTKKILERLKDAGVPLT